jgi:hypothetical protein
MEVRPKARGRLYCALAACAVTVAALASNPVFAAWAWHGPH